MIRPTASRDNKWLEAKDTEGTCKFPKSIRAKASLMCSGNNGFSTMMTFLALGSVSNELEKKN